jgi:hypothetical protein
MDLARFGECSRAFGADRRRWPPGEHALYDRFAATSAGKAILAEAARTDDFLDALQPATPDPRRVQDICSVPRPAWQGLGKVAAALAASAVLGFIVGYLHAHGATNTGAIAQLLLGPPSLQEIGL